MGKIKSSWEIAMERAARIQPEMVANDPPRESVQYLKAAQILTRLYLDGEKELEQLTETVNRYPKKAGPEAKQALLKTAIAGLTLENCPRVIALVDCFWKDETGRKYAALLNNLQHRYRENLEQNRNNLSRDGLRAGLARLHQAGISGSAIAGINLERSPGWKQTAAKTVLPFEKELEQLKEKLLLGLTQ